MPARIECLLKFLWKNRKTVQHLNFVCNANNKKILIDFRKIDERNSRVGETRNLRAFFHETGHLFDHQAYSPKTTIYDHLISTGFNDILKQDYLNYANNILTSNGLSAISDFNALSHKAIDLLSDDLRFDEHLRSSVSDMIHGLTNEQVFGEYGHFKPGYWNRVPVAKETIAGMFEGWMTNNERAIILQKYFPNAYKQFLEAIMKMEARNP